LRGTLALLMVCAAGAAACDGGAARPGGPPDQGCDGAALVFANCSGCHDGSASTGGFLDLRWPDQIAGLIGKPASGPKCASRGDLLIKADGSGLFVDKLLARPPCGDQMPQGVRPFSLQETACVAQWVMARAAPR
jgi:hypothetical protein